jgi:Zn-dependent protease
MIRSQIGTTTGSGWLKSQHILAVINDIALLFPVFLIIFTWRGFIQAFIARTMGDRTAQQNGFLSLNPLAHIDLSGMLIVMGVFFFLGGFFYDVIPRAILLILLIVLGVRWTIPVPIDDTQFTRYRLGGIITSLSGPLSNFLLAFIATGLLRLSLWEGFPHYIVVTLFEILRTVIDVALFFFVLDMIPLPPFDGGRMLRYLLPQSAQHIVHWLEEYAFFIFLILFFAPGISDIFCGSLISISVVIKRLMFMIFF